MVGDHPSAGSLAVEESGDRLAERVRRYPLDVRAGSDAAKGGTDVVPVAIAAHGVGEHWPIRSPDLLAPGYEHRYAPAGEHEDPAGRAGLRAGGDEALTSDPDDGAFRTKRAAVGV